MSIAKAYAMWHFFVDFLFIKFGRRICNMNEESKIAGFYILVITVDLE